MRRRKLFAAAAAALIVFSSIAGCGNGSGQAKPAETSMNESGTEREQNLQGKPDDMTGDHAADAMAAITDDGTEKTITYWHTFTEGARKDYIDQMVEAYMEEHPNVTVNVEVYPWNVFTQKWTAGLAAGALPDVSSINPDNLFAIKQAGAVLPMNPLINALGEDYFLKKPLENFSDGDTILGIPYYLHSYVMWYRKDVLEENNLQVPGNWEELLHAVETVADPPNRYGFTIAMSKNDQMCAQLLSCFAKAEGAALITEDNKGNLTDPKVVKAIQLMADLYRAGSPEGSVNYGLSEQNDVFFQGKSTFAFGSGFHINGVKENSPQLLDKIAAVPFMGPDGETLGDTTFVIGLMGWNQTKYPETVYDFIRFHFEKDRYIDFLHLIPGGQLPATSEAAEAEEFYDNETIQKFQQEIQYIQKGIEKGTFIGMDYGLTPAAAALTSQGIIEECLQDIVLNGTSAEDAAKKANDKLNAAIEILME
ncbi:MAG: sugar ABC transporter substrate-binding protein [Lachnospiraceae bacterium]|nr:sugar ABC transporter substrate-binding protein [Lachnospiraceae bacterium]